MKYRLVQETRDQGTWTSEIFDGDAHEARRVVLAGFIQGEPRGAVDENGRKIFALDAKGREIK